MSRAKKPLCITWTTVYTDRLIASSMITRTWSPFCRRYLPTILCVRVKWWVLTGVTRYVSLKRRGPNQTRSITHPAYGDRPATASIASSSAVACPRCTSATGCSLKTWALTPWPPRPPSTASRGRRSTTWCRGRRGEWRCARGPDEERHLFQSLFSPHAKKIWGKKSNDSDLYSQIFPAAYPF